MKAIINQKKNINSSILENLVSQMIEPKKTGKPAAAVKVDGMVYGAIG
jgi:hypothetical protein